MVRFSTMRNILLVTLALALTLTNSSPGMASRKAKREKIPVGVQLYSVRDDCAKDLEKVFAAVAEAGYDGVEYAGYHGRTAEELKALQDKYGLKCCGTHTGLDSLLGDEFQKTVDFNKTIGNKYLIVPWLPKDRKGSKTAWVKTAKLFNEIATRAKEQGMRVGYHNHSDEFPKMDGEVPWDIFYEHTNPDVIMQMDTGNAGHGGADAVEFLKRHKGRTVTIHLKEYAPDNRKALIGEGKVDWKGVFDACENGGGVEWYIVEQESYAYPPLECIAKCRENLKKLGR